MNHLQLFGGIGIGVLIVLILYTLYLVFSYMANHAAGDRFTARKIKRRINWTTIALVVVMIAVLTPTFIWPR